MKIKNNLKVGKMSKISIRSFYLLSLLSLSLFTTSTIYAEELTISNNGQGSSSTINATAPNTQTIEQKNDAKVTNDVAPSANTGSNTASGNTNGTNTITTGSALSNVEVKNSLNNSKVNGSCCVGAEGTTVKIEHNGQGSTNTASVNSPRSTEVNIAQTASISDTISGEANSGGNVASGNNGDVTIKTGNISVKEKIVNEHINQAEVTVSRGEGDVSVKIANNGKDSMSSVSINNPVLTEVSVLNSIVLKNVLDFYANSGGNKAESNSGKVVITTGDVLIDTFIKNTDINLSKVVLDCCVIQAIAPPPPPGGGGNSGGGNNNNNGSNNTSNNTSSTSAGSSSTTTSQGGGPGEILGTTLMPATGSFWLLYLTILSALMFMLGIYLRFHPGRDPGFRAAYA